MDLDDAYDNVGYIPDAAAYEPRWRDAAEAFRQRMSLADRARLGLMYGHGTRQAMDLFLPDQQPVGLTVFVHGGYWRRFDRSLFSHFATGFLAHGQAVMLPSYDLVPRVRICDIARQVAQAITVAAHEVAGPVRLVGHSAGGHLVARMLAPGMLEDDVHRRIAQAMPISPVSDLRPLLETRMNADFRLDADEAEAESPVFQPKPDMPVTVWVGADEKPVFLDQARWLAEAWNCGHVVQPKRHHFDVIDDLLDPQSEMVRTLMRD
ncbi:alpha/beta hydrolase [Puniceibacterium sediminis]|uniref:Alpha/beta hydrolase family protein n=1 Tax=Puniceibacterium sediminis TaxID=1608407 RepID=A0A238VVG2_9RHOB|nr:alpha/beta hydrolase [Puniceibacterium sediminis]SNR38228.1 Alpha/beta hydrolase family protein [Puniceibacterium sediminis]